MKLYQQIFLICLFLVRHIYALNTYDREEVAKLVGQPSLQKTKIMKQMIGLPAIYQHDNEFIEKYLKIVGNVKPIPATVLTLDIKQGIKKIKCIKNGQWFIADQKDTYIFTDNVCECVIIVIRSLDPDNSITALYHYFEETDFRFTIFDDFLSQTLAKLKDLNNAEITVISSYLSDNLLIIKQKLTNLHLKNITIHANNRVWIRPTIYVVSDHPSGPIGIQVLANVQNVYIFKDGAVKEAKL